MKTKMNAMCAATALFSLVAGAGDAFGTAEARARELCAKMTLEEKAGELMVYEYMSLGKDPWGAYTNKVCRNEIGAMMRVMSAKETRRIHSWRRRLRALRQGLESHCRAGRIHGFRRRRLHDGECGTLRHAVASA